MRTNRKKEIISVRMLLGLSVALATTLCTFEYGKPYFGIKSLIGMSEEIDLIEMDDIPITRAKLPDPPKTVVSPPERMIVAVVDPIAIITELIDPMSELPEFNFDDQMDFYFPKASEIVEEIAIFLPLEDMPKFPGGDMGLYDYIEKKVKYPSILRDVSLQGTVYVQFVVGKDGYVDKESIEILRTPHLKFSEEAIKAVENMPQWIPGKQRGKPVGVYFTMPIRFALN